MTVSRARAVALSRHVARQPDSEEYANRTGVPVSPLYNLPYRTARHGTLHSRPFSVIYYGVHCVSRWAVTI